MSVESFALPARGRLDVEHMALTRARVLVGSTGARDEVDAVVRDIRFTDGVPTGCAAMS